MPVIVSRAQIDAVKAALASVKSNGQAFAACTAAQKAARDLASVLRSIGGSIRLQSAKNLDEYGKRVAEASKPLDGQANQPVSAASWEKAKTAIFNLYMLAYTIQSTTGDVDLGDTWGAAFSSAVRDLPATIDKAVKVAVTVAKESQKFVTKTVKETVGGVVSTAGSVAGSAVWESLKAFWPLLLVAGLAVGVAIYARGKIRIPGVPP